MLEETDNSHNFLVTASDSARIPAEISSKSTIVVF
jgi:hypothetical protein